MRTIEQMAPDARKIVERAVADLGDDLAGFSAVDLLLDNLPDHISSADAKVVLVCAGVDGMLSKRLVHSYSLSNKE